MPSMPVSSFDDTSLPDAAIAILSKASEEEPLFTKAKVSEVIRHAPGKRAVIRGKLAEDRAVFRIYYANEGECRRHWDELQRIWPLMQSGTAMICQPLACAPNTGVLAVSEVPGTPLLQHLYQSAPEERERWLVPAARWLRQYTDCSETESDAAAEGWATRAARAASGQAFAQLRRLEEPLIEEMRRLVDLIEGSRWRVAIVHGDFHPNNLIAGPYPALTGIDCGGSRKMPIYKDMARFLMHMGRRGMIPSRDRYLGVDRAGIEAFADAFDLTEKERRLFLPFFIVVEALLRVETRELSSARIRHAGEMTEALLADLQEIGR